MKKLILIPVLGVLLAGCCNVSQTDDWVSLFNGTSLDGWELRGGDGNFFVEDGMIVAETKLGPPNSFLCTKKPYTDFIMEVEFKVHPSLNTGVQIRSAVHKEEVTTEYMSGKLKKTTKTWPVGRVYGYQIEIDPSPRAWTGAFYEEGRRGYLQPLTDNEPARKAFRQNEWNHLRIEARGNHFRTWVNGVPAADYKDDDLIEGFIGLQLHGIRKKEQEHKRIYWKNLKIIEL